VRNAGWARAAWFCSRLDLISFTENVVIEYKIGSTVSTCCCKLCTWLTTYEPSRGNRPKSQCLSIFQISKLSRQNSDALIAPARCSEVQWWSGLSISIPALSAVNTSIGQVLSRRASISGSLLRCPDGITDLKVGCLMLRLTFHYPLVPSPVPSPVPSDRAMTLRGQLRQRKTFQIPCRVT
jgi:hypothetical protein